jgi:hypothetical protein
VAVPDRDGEQHGGGEERRSGHRRRRPHGVCRECEIAREPWVAFMGDEWVDQELGADQQDKPSGMPLSNKIQKLHVHMLDGDNISIFYHVMRWWVARLNKDQNSEGTNVPVWSVKVTALDPWKNVNGNWEVRREEWCCFSCYMIKTSSHFLYHLFYSQTDREDLST